MKSKSAVPCSTRATFRTLLGDVLRPGGRLGLELATGLGKLNLGTLDLKEAKRLARRAVESIENGLIGYTLITARKE